MGRRRASSDAQVYFLTLIFGVILVHRIPSFQNSLASVHLLAKRSLSNQEPFGWHILKAPNSKHLEANSFTKAAGWEPAGKEDTSANTFATLPLEFSVA